MRTKIEARQFSEEADARSCKSGQRYEIAAKAVFAELGRCGENEKTNQFDSDLTTTEPFDESNCNGEDRGGSRDTSEKRRGRRECVVVVVVSTLRPHPPKSPEEGSGGGFPIIFRFSRKPRNTRTKPTSASSPCIGDLREDALALPTRSPRVVFVVVVDLFRHLLRRRAAKEQPTERPILAQIRRKQK